MNRSIEIVSFLFTLILITSCGSVKEIEPVVVKLEKTRRSELLHALDSISTRKPSFFYSKITTSYSDTTTEKAFKTSIRMVSDSAINLTVSYAAIPVITSMITKDSLKIVNRIDKCLIFKDLSFIKETFGIDFKYNNVEELFLGLPLDYDTTQRYFQMQDPTNYVISSHKKIQIRRNERNPSDDIVIQYFLNSKMNELVKTLVNSPHDSTEIEINYITRELIENFHIPKDVLIQVRTPKNNIRIDLTYEKTEVNIRQPLVVTIPEGYEICK